MIIILTERIDKVELKDLCEEYFKSFVKIVVDIENDLLAIGGELHADAEAILINQGSNQKDLWGANFYPFKDPLKRLEYTALINIRARDDDFVMEIQSDQIREKILELSERFILGKNDSLA